MFHRAEGGGLCRSSFGGPARGRRRSHRRLLPAVSDQANEQAAAIVDRCPRNAIEQDAHVAERRAVVGKAHDPFENLRSFPPGVCNEHMRRIGKIWVERHTEQTALASSYTSCEHASVRCSPVSGLMRLIRPGRSVTQSQPSGPQRISHGVSKFVATVRTASCCDCTATPAIAARMIHRSIGTPHQRYNNPSTATEQQRPHYQQRLPQQVRRSLPGKSDASFGCRCDCTSRGVDLSAIQCHVASSDRASAGRSASTMCGRRCACAGRVGEIQNAWLVLKT